MVSETYHSGALRAVRKDLGISQEDAAVMAGTDQSYLSKCERGLIVPTLQVFAGLASAYGMSVSELIDRCFTSDADTEVA